MFLGTTMTLQVLSKQDKMQLVNGFSHWVTRGRFSDVKNSTIGCIVGKNLTLTSKIRPRVINMKTTFVFDGDDDGVLSKLFVRADNQKNDHDKSSDVPFRTPQEVETYGHKKHLVVDEVWRVVGDRSDVAILDVASGTGIMGVMVRTSEMSGWVGGVTHHLEQGALGISVP